MNQSPNPPHRHGTAREFLVVFSFLVVLAASVYLQRRHPDHSDFLLTYPSLLVVFCLFSVSTFPLVLAESFRTKFQRLIVTCVSGVGLTFIWLFVFGAYVFLYKLGHPTPD